MKNSLQLSSPTDLRKKVILDIQPISNFDDLPNYWWNKSTFFELRNKYSLKKEPLFFSDGPTDECFYHKYDYDLPGFGKLEFLLIFQKWDMYTMNQQIIAMSIMLPNNNMHSTTIKAKNSIAVEKQVEDNNKWFIDAFWVVRAMISRVKKGK